MLAALDVVNSQPFSWGRHPTFLATKMGALTSLTSLTLFLAEKAWGRDPAGFNRECIVRLLGLSVSG